MRGLFADDSSNNLLSRAEMEETFNLGKIIGDDEQFGLVVLSDVAAGEYRDDSIAWIAKIIGDGDHGPEGAARGVFRAAHRIERKERD